MSDIEKIQLFEQKKIRTAWDEEKQEWFFSIVDVCGVLTGQPDYDLAKNYWKVLKHRLIKEGNESVTKCNQLKLPSPKDGKRYATDVADMALMFRIIESIPSKKAEPSQAPPGIRIERIYVKRTYMSQIPFQTAQHAYSQALAFQSARVKQ